MSRCIGIVKINARYTKYSYLIINAPYIEAQPLIIFDLPAGTLGAIRTNLNMHVFIQSFEHIISIIYRVNRKTRSLKANKCE